MTFLERLKRLNEVRASLSSLRKEEDELKEGVLAEMAPTPDRAYQCDGYVYEVRELPQYEFPESIIREEEVLEERKAEAIRTGEAVHSVKHTLRVTKAKTNT